MMVTVQLPSRLADVHRNGATADLMLGRYVVVIGGISGGVIADTMLVYDLLLKVWSEFRVPGTPKVYGHATCVVNQTFLYLQGGCCDVASNTTNGLHKLDMDFEGTIKSGIMTDEQTDDGETNQCDFSMTWTALPSTLLGCRTDHTLTYEPDVDMLYLVGGLGGSASQEEMLTCPETSLKSGKWVAVAAKGAVPQKRSNHSMTCLDESRLLLIGGITKRNAKSVDVWIFDANQESWTKVDMAGLKPASLSNHTATFVSDEFIFILGGDGEKTQKMCLNLTNKTWRTLPDLGQPISRSRHSAIHVGNRIFIFGGCGKLTWQKNLLELDIKLLARTRRLPQPEFSDDYTTIIASAKFSDAEIVLDDNTRIPVHTLVLSTRCDYFAKLTEFQGTEVSHREIRMSGVERSTMLQVISYIYSWVLPQTQDFQESMSLYKAADRLGIQLLAEHATVQLLEDIKIENLVLLLNLGNETNSNQIINACAKYLHKNREDAVIHDILKQLDPAVLLSVAQSWLTTA